MYFLSQIKKRTVTFTIPLKLGYYKCSCKQCLVAVIPKQRQKPHNNLFYFKHHWKGLQTLWNCIFLISLVCLSLINLSTCPHFLLSLYLSTSSTPAQTIPPSTRSTIASRPVQARGRTWVCPNN